MSKKPISFVFMLDWIMLFKMLDSKDQIDEILDAISATVNGEEVRITQDKTKFAWRIIEPKLTENLTKWREECIKRSEAGRKGAQKKLRNSKECLDNDKQCFNNAKQSISNDKQCFSKDKQSQADNEYEYEYEYENDIDNDSVSLTSVRDRGTGEEIPRTKRPKFTKPTIDEIEQYAFEKGLSVDAHRFYDYYESVGWKIGGKAPMKNWRSALNNWSRNDRNKATASQDNFFGNEFDEIIRQEGL